MAENPPLIHTSARPKVPVAEHYQGPANQFPRCYSPEGRAYGIRRPESPDAIQPNDPAVQYQHAHQSQRAQPVQFPVSGVFGNTYESSRIPPVQFPTEPLFATTIRPSYRHPPISFPCDPIRINNTGMDHPPTFPAGSPLQQIRENAQGYPISHFRQNVAAWPHPAQAYNTAQAQAPAHASYVPPNQSASLPLQSFPASDSRFDAGYPASFAAEAPHANATIQPIQHVQYERARNSYPAHNLTNDPLPNPTTIPAALMKAHNMSTAPAVQISAAQTANTRPAASFNLAQTEFSQPAVNLAAGGSPPIDGQPRLMHATNLTNGPESRDPQQLALHGLRNVQLADQHLISGPSMPINPNDPNAPLSQPAATIPRAVMSATKRPLPALPPKQLATVLPPNVVPSIPSPEAYDGRARETAIGSPGTQYARNMSPFGHAAGPPGVPIGSRPPASYFAAQMQANYSPRQTPTGRPAHPRQSSYDGYFPQQVAPHPIQSTPESMHKGQELPLQPFNAFVADASKSSQASTSTAESCPDEQNVTSAEFAARGATQNSNSDHKSIQGSVSPKNVPLPMEPEASEEATSVEHVSQPQVTLPTFSFGSADEKQDTGKTDSSLPSISFSIAPPSPAKRSESTYIPKITEVLDDADREANSNKIGDTVTTRSLANDLTCASCSMAISGRTLSAMTRRWHPDCFKCAHCGEGLEHVAFFEHQGKPYCHFDYQEQFSRRCYQCKTPIEDESFITLDDPTLGKRDYHELHFFCAECGDPFLDPKSLRRDAENASEPVAKPFVVHEGWAYCEHCNINLHKAKCKACKKPIEDEVLRAMNADWHEDCFRCQRCNEPLEDTFLIREDAPHCDECYRILLRSDL